MPIHPAMFVNRRDTQIPLGGRDGCCWDMHGPPCGREDATCGKDFRRGQHQMPQPVAGAIGHDGSRILRGFIPWHGDVGCVVDIILSDQGRWSRRCRRRCQRAAWPVCRLANVPIAPSAALRRDPFFKQPFAGAASFQSGAPDDQVKLARSHSSRFANSPSTRLSTQRRMIASQQVDPHLS